MAQKRIEATISGRVQMVMFRDFTKRKARKLGLTGFVKNMPDGTVRVVAEGEEEALNALLEKLRKGPIAARVDEAQVNWAEVTGELDSFLIA